MKLYTVQIGMRTFQIRSTTAAEAVKKAVRAWQAGREEPKELALTVRAAEIPAVSEIASVAPVKLG